MKPMLQPLCAAIIWMLSLAAPVAAGPLEDATAADDKGDYATALQLLRTPAVSSIAPDARSRRLA